MLLFECVALSSCSTEYFRCLKCNFDSSMKPLQPIPTNKPHSQPVIAGVVVAWYLRGWGSRSSQASVNEPVKFSS